MFNYLENNKNYLKVEIKNLAILNNSTNVYELKESFFEIEKIVQNFYSKDENWEERYSLHRPEIIRVQYNSPAEVIAWVNPGWLCFFILFVVNYDELHTKKGRFFNFLFTSEQKIIEEFVEIYGLTKQEVEGLKSILQFTTAKRITSIQNILANLGLNLEGIKQKLLGNQDKIKITVKQKKKK